MNLNSMLEVLNANKGDNFVVVGVRGKVSSAVVADNLVKVSLVASKAPDAVESVLAVLGKLDASVAGALEVVANGKVIVSAQSNEGYVICKVS